MRLSKEEKDGVMIVQVDGEININTSPELRSAFMELVDQQTPRIVVDFKEVSYIDSSGLATLVEMTQNIKGHNGELALAHVTEKISGIFELTKIDKLFSFYNTQDEAVASLSNS